MPGENGSSSPSSSSSMIIMNRPDSDDLYQIFQPLAIVDNNNQTASSAPISHWKESRSGGLNHLMNSVYPLLPTSELMGMINPSMNGNNNGTIGAGGHQNMGGMGAGLGSSSTNSGDSPWNLSPSASRKGSSSAAGLSASSTSSSESAPPSPGSCKESAGVVGAGFNNPNSMNGSLGFVDVVPFPYPPRKNVFIEPGSGMRDVPMWLKTLRLHKYTSLFQQISYEDMLNLDEEKLERQGVTKGARQKIVVCVRKLKGRTELLKQLEKDLIEPGSIRTTVQELKSMITTPIRPYPPPGRPELYQSRIDGIDMSPEQLDDENIQAHFTRVLGKLSTQMFAVMGSHDCSEEEQFGTLLHILDRCLNHEAFTQAQKRRVVNWKQVVKKVWHPVPGGPGFVGVGLNGPGGLRGKSTPPHSRWTNRKTINNNNNRNPNNNANNPNNWNQPSKWSSPRPRNSWTNTELPQNPPHSVHQQHPRSNLLSSSTNSPSRNTSSPFLPPQQHINNFMANGSLFPTGTAQLQAAMLGILNAANNIGAQIDGGGYVNNGGGRPESTASSHQQNCNPINPASVQEMTAALTAYSGLVGWKGIGNGRYNPEQQPITSVQTENCQQDRHHQTFNSPQIDSHPTASNKNDDNQSETHQSLYPYDFRQKSQPTAENNGQVILNDRFIEQERKSRTTTVRENGKYSPSSTSTNNQKSTVSQPSSNIAFPTASTISEVVNLRSSPSFRTLDNATSQLTNSSIITPDGHNPIAENLWRHAVAQSSSLTSETDSNNPNVNNLSSSSSSSPLHLRHLSTYPSFPKVTTKAQQIIPSTSSVSSATSSNGAGRNVPKRTSNLNAYNFGVGSPSSSNNANHPSANHPATALIISPSTSLFSNNQEDGDRVSKPPPSWTSSSCNQQGFGIGGAESLSKSMEKLCQSVAEVALVESNDGKVRDLTSNGFSSPSQMPFYSHQSQFDHQNHQLSSASPGLIPPVYNHSSSMSFFQQNHFTSNQLY